MPGTLPWPYSRSCPACFYSYPIPKGRGMERCRTAHGSIWAQPRQGGVRWEGVVPRPYPVPPATFQLLFSSCQGCLLAEALPSPTRHLPTPFLLMPGMPSGPKAEIWETVPGVHTHGCSHAHKGVCCFVSLMRDWGIEREGLGQPPPLSRYLVLLHLAVHPYPL